MGDHRISKSTKHSNNKYGGKICDQYPTKIGGLSRLRKDQSDPQLLLGITDVPLGAHFRHRGHEVNSEFEKEVS